MSTGRILDIVLSNAVIRLSVLACFIPQIVYRPLKFTLSCEVDAKRRKSVFWGPDFQGGRIPQILDMHFQIALNSEHMAGFG